MCHVGFNIAVVVIVIVSPAEALDLSDDMPRCSALLITLYNSISLPIASIAEMKPLGHSNASLMPALVRIASAIFVRSVSLVRYGIRSSQIAYTVYTGSCRESPHPSSNASPVPSVSVFHSLNIFPLGGDQSRSEI